MKLRVLSPVSELFVFNIQGKGLKFPILQQYIILLGNSSYTDLDVYVNDIVFTPPSDEPTANSGHTYSIQVPLKYE